MEIVRHLVAPFLSMAFSALEMASVAMLGAFIYIVCFLIILLIGFVIEKILLTNKLGTTSNWINDKIIPPFDEFFTNKDVLLFLFLSLTAYNWIALYNDYPTIRGFLNL